MQIENQTDVKESTSDEKTYELSMIDQMCRGNQEQIKKMVIVFIEQLPLSVEEMKVAYDKKDFNSIKATAHRIKPTLTYYGVAKLEDDIALIESMAHEAVASPSLALKIDTVCNRITQVVAQMKKDFLY